MGAVFLPAVVAVSLTGCASGSLVDTETSTTTTAAPGETVNAVSYHTATGKTVPGKTAAVLKNAKAYKVGPQDVLEISVFKVPELSKTVQVSDVGTINYPLLGEVRTAGLTTRDIEHSLTKKLGVKYLQKPQVSVFIKEYNSQKVTVEGAIKKPGVYPIRGGITLLQTIATAEGFTEASDDVVVVFRTVNGKRRPKKFDVAAIRSGKLNDPALHSGDIIIVGTSAIKKGWNSLMKGLPLAKLFFLL